MDVETMSRIISGRLWVRVIALALAFLACTWPSGIVPDEDEAALRAQWVGGAYLPAPDTAVKPLSCMSLRRKQFQPIILKASDRYGVDPDLIRAVIHVESAYDPYAVSNRGASGLMQLMPATARELGVTDVFDPEHNIFGGVKYLKQLLSLFDGDPELALAAYNAGMGRVRKYDGVPPYEATRDYIRRVLALVNEYRSDGDQVLKSASAI